MPTLMERRDLKSQNVLLTKTLQAKVADVGGATIHSHTYVPGAFARLLAAAACCSGCCVKDGYDALVNIAV